MEERLKQRRFDALARRYADDLYRFALWRCGDPTQARDLVQETFLRAWKSLDALQDAGAAKGWLITILRREHARTFERKQLSVTDIDGVIVEDQDGESPEERAHRQDLRTAIAGLEEKYREPLILQSLMGLSIAEIATVLELSETATMTRVFRARKKLRQALAD